MASLASSITKRIWKKQNKAPFSHDAKHGGLKEETFFVAGAPYTIKTPRFAWPLTAKGFPPEEKAA